MPRVAFTPNLQRHLSCPDVTVPGSTVREVLDAVFEQHPRLRGYVVDDQARLRKHLAVFVGGEPLRDREHLSDLVAPDGAVYVYQALSGG